MTKIQNLKSKIQNLESKDQRAKVGIQRAGTRDSGHGLLSSHRPGLAACSLLFALCSLALGLDVANPAAGSGAAVLNSNPALLTTTVRPRFSYRILGLETYAGSNSFSLAQYNRYSGAFLDDQKKQEIVGSIPVSGFKLGVDARADLLAMTVADFGLSVGTVAAAGTNLPRDIFDLALWGNSLNREYSASTLSADAIAYADITLATGIPLGNGFAAGLGLKYLRGLAIAQSLQSDGYLITTPCVINSEVLSAYRWATGGNGFGLDLGATYDLKIQDPKSKIQNPLRFGLALLNLNLGINWTQGIQTGVFRLALDSFNVGRIGNDDVASIENVQNPGSPFRTQLPMYVNLGVSYQPVRSLTVGASLLEGTANTVLSSTIPRARISAEYRGLRWLPFSADAAIGGNQGPTVGAGLGLDLGGLLLQTRLANTGGMIMNAKGLCAGLSLTYSSWSPGARDENPSLLDLHSEEGNYEMK